MDSNIQLFPRFKIVIVCQFIDVLRTVRTFDVLKIVS